MRCIDRFQKYRKEDMDKILLDIRNGNIKCGKYSHLVKVDENKSLKEGHLFKDIGKEIKIKELFKDGKSSETK